MIEYGIISIVEAFVNPLQPIKTYIIPTQKLEELENCQNKDYIL